MAALRRSPTASRKRGPRFCPESRTAKRPLLFQLGFRGAGEGWNGIVISLRFGVEVSKQPLECPPGRIGWAERQILGSIVQGYLNYHAGPGNIDGLSPFRHRLIRLWRTTTVQRGGQRRLTW